MKQPDEKLRASWRKATNKWAKKNRERKREMVKEWYWRVRHKRLGELRIIAKKRRAEARTKVLAFFGGCCVRCGFTDPRALQIDHIHGNGILDNKRFSNKGGRDAYYRGIQRDTKAMEKYQLLCANCNWIKKYENNENAKNHHVTLI